MRSFVLIVCLFFASFMTMLADEGSRGFVGNSSDTSVIEKFAIYYRFDATDFDQTYLSNSETAAHIKNYLLNSARIDSITIHAWASPEGAYRHNVWLSRERARTAKRFLLSHSPDSLKLNAEKIRISPEAENWGGAN